MNSVLICIRAAIAFAVLAAGTGVRAESPDRPDPNYHNLRYLDDFSHTDPNKPADFWDPLKFIPMGESPGDARSYLTLGGELRERFESYNHPNFGIKAPANNFYDLHRLQLDADLHLTEYFRAFLQFAELDRFGKRGVYSTTDIDRGEFTQAFVDIRVPTPLGDAPMLRYGREELLFGFQRLIAVREGPNARRSFDGYRISDQWGGISIDAFSVRPLNNNPGSFDDPSSKVQKLKGVYVTVPVGPVLKSDLYVLDYENDAAKFRGLSGTEMRETIGTRLFGKYEGFDWNLEFAKQTGTFRNFDINARVLAGIVGTGLPICRGTRALPSKPTTRVETIPSPPR